MKTAKKALLLTVCALVLVVATVMGTMAFLTATQTVTNTFTVGDIKMAMDEQDIDGNKVIAGYDKDTFGDPTKLDPARDMANSYFLQPGLSYVKDPIVRVKASVAHYLFVKVENGLADIIDEANTIEDQIIDNGWTALPEVSNVYYKDIAAGNAEIQTYKVFQGFKIKADVDNATLEANKDDKIVVTAYAIQKDGIGSVKNAWTELNKA